MGGSWSQGVHPVCLPLIRSLAFYRALDSAPIPQVAGFRVTIAHSYAFAPSATEEEQKPLIQKTTTVCLLSGFRNPTFHRLGRLLVPVFE